LSSVALPDSVGQLSESELLILEAGTHFASYNHPGSDEAQDPTIRSLLDR
jgi:hypothetical protein